MPDNLFTLCQPRPDVLQGTVRESDFAADLSQVLRGDAPDEYKRADLFFANTYPTKGLCNSLNWWRCGLLVVQSKLLPSFDWILNLVAARPTR